MPLASVTLSSVGTSTPVALAYRNGVPTTVSVTASSSTGGFWVVQTTLDDIMRTASSLVVWQGISSAPGTAPGTIYASSSSFPDGLLLTISGPVGAVRINSSVIGTNLVMKVMQGESW
jgi:hypothetical protein